jgi:hypothetical protein
MILKERTGDVETGGVEVKKTFQIKACRKAFEILSSGIYSDKVRAVIRELSTNAADAHVAANKKDIPFVVHLPNGFEPYFSVKDFGTGLSEDGVMNLYTTYFESNKTASNEFTGALGLGSKSPFCYTDSFSVISRFNGKKTTYNCYINSDGVPTPVKMGEEDTTEENGLEVSFAVKKEDFQEFYTKAVSVLSCFVLPPIVEGYGQFAFEKRNYVYKTDFYGYHGNGTRYDNQQCRVIMGNVGYTLSPYDIKGLDYGTRDMLSGGIDIFVKIGEVNMTADREKLSYDDHTITNLKRIIEDIREDIKARFEKELSDCKNMWEARLYVNSKNGLLHSLGMGSKRFKWNGQEISSTIEIKPMELDNLYLRRKSVSRRPAGSYVNVSDRLTFYIDDVGKRGAITKIIYDIRTNQKESAYLITATGKALDDFLDRTGIRHAPIIKASTLPDVPKVARTGNGTTAKSKGIHAFRYTSTGSGAPTNYWKDEVVDLTTESGYYVVIDYYKWKGIGEEMRHPYYIKDIISGLNKIGYFNNASPTIIGVKSKYVNKITSNSNWIDLTADVKKFIDTNLAKFKKYRDITNVYIPYWLNFAKKNVKFNSPLIQKVNEDVAEHYKMLSDATTNWNNVYTLCNNIGYDLGNDVANGKGDTFTKRGEEITNAYPLLKFVADLADNIHVVNEYTDLIDNAKKKGIAKAA